ncbi:MAG: hypothetical protein JO037_26420 [Actinobacteria bacterium]|nr:hypothetical protein [Actinomycetota bacterium]
MTAPRFRPAAWTLAGLVLLLAGLAGMAPAPGGGVTARLGGIAVTATGLRPGPGGTLTASMQVRTTGPPSDQLDAAIAAGGVPVAVYHQQVDVAQISDLADCGGGRPPATLVRQWLHYAPLPVPGRSAGPAQATLTVPPATPLASGGVLAITLYFAQAGPVTLRLRVVR